MNEKEFRTEQFEVIAPGLQCYFGDVWDGVGDGEEILNSGAVALYDGSDEVIVGFEIVQDDEDTIKAMQENEPLKVWIKIKDIFI